MKVIRLPTARTQKRSAPPRHWYPDEWTELIRLYLAREKNGQAQEYACGETENGDPQFYLLGPDPARPCTTCVSRISKNSGRWYVIEDGLGLVLDEGEGLRALVNRVNGHWRNLRQSFMMASLMLFGHSFDTGASIEESAVAAVKCLLA